MSTENKPSGYWQRDSVRRFWWLDAGDIQLRITEPHDDEYCWSVFILRLWICGGMERSLVESKLAAEDRVRWMVRDFQAHVGVDL